MMNPDLNDPAWLETREALWKQVAEGMSDELSRKQLKHLRPMFFEVEFDYGNEEKYGEFKYQCERASNFCPAQNPARWRKYLLEDLPRWLGDSYDLQGYMRSLVGFSGDRSSIGWDMDTELEVIGYVFGDYYVDGEYEFEGRHIAYPISANTIHREWIRQSFQWLIGNRPQSDIKSVHLIDYWVSALPYVHPIFFKYMKSSRGMVRLAQDFLQQILVLIQDYSLENLKVKRKKERLAIIEEDKGHRRAFAERLRETLDTVELPPGFAELWAAAKQSDFKPSRPFGYMDPAEDDGEEVVF